MRVGRPVAHNTARSNDGLVPVIIEQPNDFPFEPGELAADWHEATDEEYAVWLDYWSG